jgi:hypothetical protein
MDEKIAILSGVYDLETTDQEYQYTWVI